MNRPIKQAWALLKQNKLFSVLYIAGTGLAIAMTMAVFVAHYVKIAPIYPETNRANTYVLKSVGYKLKKGGSSNSGGSYILLRDWWYPLQNVEAVSGKYDQWNIEDYIQPAEGMAEIKVKTKYVDPTFFRVFEFRFIDGKPFTQADFDSGLYQAVITDELAKSLFGTTDVVGKIFSFNYTDCRITGVVKGGSTLASDSFAQLYLPYTTQVGYDRGFSEVTDLVGNFATYFLVKDEAQGKALEQEIAEMVRKYNASDEKGELILNGPDPVWKAAYRLGNLPLDMTEIVLFWLGLMFVFLLVPALNLSGMISTRMESRLPEMGVSKAFGASKSLLLRQVLNENLVLTGLGGLFGLLLAWVVLVLGRNWVFGLIDPFASLVNGTAGLNTDVSAEMLFSPWLFVAAFVVCLLMNLLSALIPAWRSLRKSIVYSLNQKK